MADPGVSKRGHGDSVGSPSYTPYVFIVREENKIHSINIVRLLQLKYMHVMQSKLTNSNQIFKLKVEGGAACSGPGSAFA